MIDWIMRRVLGYDRLTVLRWRTEAAHLKFLQARVSQTRICIDDASFRVAEHGRDIPVETVQYLLRRIRQTTHS